MAASRKSPSSNPLASAVADCLGRYVQATHRVVVGLSGGLDSVVLLHAVRECGYNVSALHVHHGLSPNADGWSDFCIDLCARDGIPLAIERVAVERNARDGLEGAARRARHAVYDHVDADWVLLAHHRGDRAETMLFNLLRGAGVRGAGAMGERNGRLLRPLLTVGRDDILAYARRHGLGWIEDESNADVRFSRNFLRHRILPVMRERFPAAEARLASASGRFAEAADLLDELAVMDLEGHEACFPLSIDVLSRLSERRARNVLRLLLSRAGVGIPSEERLAEVLRQCLTAKADRHPAVAFGEWQLRRRGQEITLEPMGYQLPRG